MFARHLARSLLTTRIPADSAGPPAAAIPLPPLPPGAGGSAIRRILSRTGPNTFKLGGGFPQYFDVAGLQRAISDSVGALTLGYGATPGADSLRAVLAAQHGREAGRARVRPDEVMVVAGSQQGIALTASALLSQAGESTGERPKVAMPAACFLAASGAVRLAGAEPVPVKMDAQGVDIEDLQRVIGEHRPKLAYVNPDFDNPTGTTLSEDRRLALLQLARDTQTPVLADNAYSELWFRSPPPPDLLTLSSRVPGSRDWLISLHSLSKTVSPAMRLGWMVAPAHVLERAEIHRQHVDTCSPLFTQEAMAQYLMGPRVPAHLAQVRKMYEERMGTLVDGLREEFGDGVRFAVPDGGMFLWLHLPQHMSGTAFAEEAMRHNVAVVPGAPFHLDGTTNTVRLSVASEPPRRILSAVRCLKRAFDDVADNAAPPPARADRAPSLNPEMAAAG